MWHKASAVMEKQGRSGQTDLILIKVHALEHTPLEKMCHRPNFGFQWRCSNYNKSAI
jgi:hypothetical protein